MNSQYSRRLEKIEAPLQNRLPETSAPPWLAETFGDLGAAPDPALVRSLTRPGWDLVNRGGKRWRPLLMTLICESLGGGDAALPLVPLVELPHNASLIHDDIEDNSDQRRGQPAVHLLYGTDTAINGGCFLYFLPLPCIEAWQAPATWKNRVYAIWGEYMRRLHLGQAMDISWHRDFSSLPSIEEYLLMCRLKTGVLARLAAVLGVYAALAGKAAPPGGPEIAPETLTEARAEAIAEDAGAAAEKLGLGFQILDDVSNLRQGNPGKKRGDDIVEGKKSLPVLLYLHRKPGAADFTARCFAAARQDPGGAPEIEALIREMEAAGAITEARERGLTLIGEAKTLFGRIPGENTAAAEEARQLLVELPERISR
jgi:octaprenyl-diphosphate synthase